METFNQSKIRYLEKMTYNSHFIRIVPFRNSIFAAFTRTFSTGAKKWQPVEYYGTGSNSSKTSQRQAY